MKEGNTKRQSTVWAFISGGVLIAAAIIALYTPWLQLCDLRKVVVTGNQQAATSELIALARLHRGQTVFSVSTSDVRKRMEQHPWVKRASVRRVLPHTLQLSVEERRVVAWLTNPSDGTVSAVAEGGVLVGEDAAQQAAVELIGAVTTGWEFGDTLADPRISGLLDRLQDGVCSLAVRSVDATDLRSVELFLQNDVRVRLGDMADVEDRLAALEALCREIGLDGYELIDVRFGGEATLMPRKAVRR